MAFEVHAHEAHGGQVGSLQITCTIEPPLLFLAGEIDQSTYHDLATALDGFATDVAGRTVRIDLSGISFCDVAGLRAFVLLAAQIQEDGRRVFLTSVPPRLCTVMRLAGWDSLTCLVITEMRHEPDNPASPREESSS